MEKNSNNSGGIIKDIIEEHFYYLLPRRDANGRSGSQSVKSIWMKHLILMVLPQFVSQ